MALNGVIASTLRYFTELGSFRGALRKSGWRYTDTFCDIGRRSPPAIALKWGTPLSLAKIRPIISQNLEKVQD